MSRSIRFTTAACELGHVLVAAGERGIGHLRLGDDPAELVRGLRAALPAASPAEPGDPLESWCAEIVRCIDDWGGRGAPPELPLALRGTPFQIRVWDQLQRIPAGEVRTYGELAREVGQPGGARAVASACARNPVAILVPCHRVVPNGGGCGGYRWGRWRKQRLLERECGAKDVADGPAGTSRTPNRADAGRVPRALARPK
ncbi:MAG: methylated-DNA--[protein]-cysteine S-methyltransferase [Deltaproteobacteria bacterium]|nr:methylated-DNA--[protein]-cysteine S-methyltransferase [Deltaproteobacteria bacterium]